MSKVSGFKAALMATVALGVVLASEYAEAEQTPFTDDFSGQLRTSTAPVNAKDPLLSEAANLEEANARIASLEAELAEGKKDVEKAPKTMVDKVTQTVLTAADMTVRTATSLSTVYYGTPVAVEGLSHGAGMVASALYGPYAYYPAKVLVGGTLYSGAYVGMGMGYVGFRYIPNAFYATGQYVGRAVYNGGQYLGQRYAPSYFGAPVPAHLPV